MIVFFATIMHSIRYAMLRRSSIDDADTLPVDMDFGDIPPLTEEDK